VVVIVVVIEKAANVLETEVAALQTAPNVVPPDMLVAVVKNPVTDG
jgi:hypothetical protein